MSFAIFRVEKIKTWGLLARASGHMNRTQPTPNADPQRTNPVLLGSGDPASDVRRHLVVAGLTPEKLRKNGVLAVRILATASPEFFRPGRMHRAGEWDKERLDAWLPTTTEFLKREFGDNLVSAILHLDEATPHIDAIFVPLDTTPRGRGASVRLNCARWFDGRKKLSAFQDRYAAALAPLGLERGVRGSRAEHKDIQRQYATMHFEAEAARDASALATLTLAEATAKHKEARSVRETANAEHERAEALAFGLEAFADGRIQRAKGDEARPAFELRPMSSEEAQAIKIRIKPAWRTLWHAVRRFTAGLEQRAEEMAERTRAATMQSLSETIKLAQSIATRAGRLASKLTPEARAEADVLNAALKKALRETEKSVRAQMR